MQETAQADIEWIASKVPGALFHTQGGLVTDATGRVLDPAGAPLPKSLGGWRGGLRCLRFRRCRVSVRQWLVARSRTGISCRTCKGLGVKLL